LRTANRKTLFLEKPDEGDVKSLVEGILWMLGGLDENNEHSA
jgi:hypothetical protein